MYQVRRRILIYHNHTGIVEALKPLLEGEGFRTEAVEEYQQLLKELREKEVHLLITDVELQEKSFAGGIEMLADIRRYSCVPILVVSENQQDNAKILALNAGADDYITASSSSMELLARVKSQLRRYTQLVNVKKDNEHVYEVDGLVIDDRMRKVSVDKREVRLTPIEYKILRLLVQQKGKVLSISEIYEAIWKMRAVGADNTIAVHIRHIREKIENDPKCPRYLKVVWGTGYKVG
jgi:DNA-binding response OmpR family regulator